MLRDEPSGQEMMANSSLHAGDIYRQFLQYDKAIEAYDRSIQVYGELSYPHFNFPAHKGKLLSFIAKDDDVETEEEIKTVFGLFDEYRSKLSSESQRNAFFDVEQSIYDLAIDFARSRRHDAQRAFHYSEVSHARSLHDEMLQSVQVSQREDNPDLKLTATFDPLTPPEILQRMPDQVQIVQYAVLDNKVLLWVVKRSGISSQEVRLDVAALRHEVEEYLSIVNEPSETREAETKQRARNLHDILIKPVEPWLDKEKLLCIVPDKFLHYMPFGTLISAATDRYLVEDFSLQEAPSSTIFVNCSERARKKALRNQERLLSVGDPSFDRNAFPELDRLPSAGREA